MTLDQRSEWFTVQAAGTMSEAKSVGKLFSILSASMTYFSSVHLAALLYIIVYVYNLGRRFL